MLGGHQATQRPRLLLNGAIRILFDFSAFIRNPCQPTRVGSPSLGRSGSIGLLPPHFYGGLVREEVMRAAVDWRRGFWLRRCAVSRHQVCDRTQGRHWSHGSTILLFFFFLKTSAGFAFGRIGAPTDNVTYCLSVNYFSQGHHLAVMKWSKGCVQSWRR